MPTYTTTGTGDSYELLVPNTIMTRGVAFCVKFHANSLDNPTLQYNTASPLALCDFNGDPITAGEIVADDIYIVIFSGSLIYCYNYLLGGDKHFGNYSKIENDGTFVGFGSSTTYEDENLDPTMLGGGGSLPSQINFASTNTRIASFSSSQLDEVSGTREIPHSWKTGSPISFHMHNYATTTDIGVVRLGLEYFFTEEGIPVTTSTTIYKEFTTTGLARAKQSESFADITPPSVLGSQFHFRFFRDASHVNDTYTGALAISTIGFHYEKDMNGSREMLVK